MPRQPNLTNPSADVLERLPIRAFRFLSTAATSRAIRALLAPRGFDAAALAEGWRLLHAVSGYVPPTEAPVVDVDPAVQAALAEVDAWDEPNFLIAHGALDVAYPSASAFLFAGDLAAAQGRGSIASVGTFLARLDALDSGKGRDKSEHKSDKAAVKKLGERSITKAVRDHLAALLKKLEAPDDETDDDAPAPPASPAPSAAVLALYAWFYEWSQTARAVIRRRDYLIRLGLAQRKPRKGGPPPTPPAS